jgi:hypothetical protein
MGWSDWMVFNPSMEEQLALERQARAALSHDNERQVRELCASLIKQNFAHQSLLIKAVGRIIELETSAQCLKAD